MERIVEREGKRRKLVNGPAAWGTDKNIGWELDETLDSQYLLRPPDEVVQNQKVENSVEIQSQNGKCEQVSGDASRQSFSIWHAEGLIRISIPMRQV